MSQKVSKINVIVANRSNGGYEACIPPGNKCCATFEETAVSRPVWKQMSSMVFLGMDLDGYARASRKY
jgi:hypothetical protein